MEQPTDVPVNDVTAREERTVELSVSVVACKPTMFASCHYYGRFIDRRLA